MSSMAGGSKVDLWAEIVAEEGQSQQPIIQQPVYQRRRRTQPQITPKDVALAKVDSDDRENRVSFPAAATKRIGWNRSLSTSGRVSIAVAACVGKQPQQKQAKKKGRKPPIPKGKAEQQPNFEKEKQYFEEVDAFELLEESPSPKNFNTWAAGNQVDSTAIPPLSARLEKWLISRKLQLSCGPSSTLSKIIETSATPPSKSIGADKFNTVTMKIPEKSSLGINSGLHSVHNRINAYLLEKDAFERGSCAKNTSSMIAKLHDEGCENIESAVKKLSLASSTSSLDHDHLSPFFELLAVCEQSAPSTLLDVFSKYCDPEGIIKEGEGTYGEAFKAGTTVCKVVPFDGELRVNGEVQKKSEELLEEVKLSRALNRLRRHDGDAYNACTTFIETLDLRVCQGPYDQSLIRAWEDWNDKHGSENDHPKDFPANQRYVVFVLQHGGKNLESFVLLNFEEGRSLLVQVTAALAVAEAAYEFEHRDLHWGNILLSRNDTAATVHFTLEGKNMPVKTSGLLVSIIDFTLSRIYTGEDVHFLDLSLDPDLFTGQKGDKQAETYRKMKEVTEDLWQESFPRTNVLWLLYLVDLLLLKKSFERSSKNERDMRSLKKRLDKYNSAKEAIFDPFFSDLFAEERQE